MANVATTKPASNTTFGSRIDIAAIQAQANAVLAKNQIQVPFVNAFDIAAAEGIAIEHRRFQPKDQTVAGFPPAVYCCS